MQFVNRIGPMATMMAVVGLFPHTPQLCAEQPSTAPPHTVSAYNPALITDVALQAGGILRGHVVRAEGQPLPEVTVKVFRGSQQMNRARTGEGGQFVIGPLRGGVYRVSAANVNGFVRLWAPKTAPPGSKSQLWIVSGPVVRAQMHPAAAIMGSPLVITGLVAAAVVIPIAIQNHQSDRRIGS